MTDLHKAAQQALELLGTWTNPPARLYRVMDNLRAALAQQAEPKGGGNLPPPLQAEPVQEPVAWMSDSDVGFEKSEFGATPTVPLYTTPPQRKPLSLTDLQEALVLTNLIDRDAIVDSEEYDEGSTLAQIDALYRIIIKE